MEREIGHFFIENDFILLQIIFFIQIPQVIFELQLRFGKPNHIFVFVVDGMVKIQVVKIQSFFAAFELRSKLQSIISKGINHTEIPDFVMLRFDRIQLNISVVQWVLVVYLQSHIIKNIIISSNLLRIKIEVEILAVGTDISF